MENRKVKIKKMRNYRLSMILSDDEMDKMKEICPEIKKLKNKRKGDKIIFSSHRLKEIILFFIGVRDLSSNDANMNQITGEVLVKYFDLGRGKNDN